MSRFCKVWDVKRYQQIAMIKQIDEEGLPEIRVYFQPEGYGLCSFIMAWQKDSDIKADKVFNEMVLKDAIEVVDKFMAYSLSEVNH